MKIFRSILKLYDRVDFDSIIHIIYCTTGCDPLSTKFSDKLKQVAYLIVSILAHISISIRLYNEWNGMETLENLAVCPGSIQVHRNKSEFLCLDKHDLFFEV